MMSEMKGQQENYQTTGKSTLNILDFLSFRLVYCYLQFFQMIAISKMKPELFDHSELVGYIELPY